MPLYSVDFVSDKATRTIQLLASNSWDATQDAVRLCGPKEELRAVYILRKNRKVKCAIINPFSSST